MDTKTKPFKSIFIKKEIQEDEEYFNKNIEIENKNTNENKTNFEDLIPLKLIPIKPKPEKKIKEHQYQKANSIQKNTHNERECPKLLKFERESSVKKVKTEMVIEGSYNLTFMKTEKKFVDNVKIICDVCQKEYANYSSLTVHKRSHKKYQLVTCKICNETFENTADLKLHELRHYHAKIYHCYICNEKKFKEKSDLQNHLAMIHNVGSVQNVGRECKFYKCKFCNNIFANQNSHDKHVIQKHTKEKSYSCPKCDKKFFFHKNLSVHLETHNPNTDHHCIVCGLVFASKMILDRHIGSSHTETSEIFATKSKFFTCDGCGTQFTQIGNMKKHKNMHCKSQSNVCEVCNIEFSSWKELQNHKDIHVKKIDCPDCNNKKNRKKCKRDHQDEWDEDPLEDPLKI